MTDRGDPGNQQHWDHALMGDTHTQAPADDEHDEYDDAQDYPYDSHHDIHGQVLHGQDIHGHDLHGHDIHGQDEHVYYDEHGYPVHPAPTRAAGRKRRRTSRAGRAAKRSLVLIVALGLVVVAAVAAVAVVKPMFAGFGGDNDYPGPGSGSVQVVVNPGDTGRTIGQTLQDAGVVKTAKAFTDAAADNPASANIQPGSYTLKEQMRAADAVAVLSDPANRNVTKVTLREGLWKSETFALLSKATGIPVADYEAAAKDSAAIGLPAAAKGNVEGYLFPATYEFQPKTTAAEQLQMMVSKALTELTKAGVTSADMERVVNVASIVEAEAARDEDRGKVARVIENRLAATPPMRLQLDSTVNYGDQKRSITTTDAQRANPANKYNTYVHPGLPPGPIGNPGAASIAAAVTPTDGPWLYFVAVNPTTGETKFATTQAEHDQYVAQFQAWCQAHKGTCS